jgi:hypothetical protein
MGIDSEHLRLMVIRPVLKKLELHSIAAENLLLGTAAHESHMGFWLKQYQRGPAMGIYQMEPKTLHDHFDTYLGRKPKYYAAVESMIGDWATLSDQLATNLAFATAMARIHYARIPEPLPNAWDWEALGVYWDTHYNRNPDKGFPHEFVQNVKKYVKGWEDGRA